MMNNYNFFKSGARLILLVAIGLFVSMAVNAQETSDSDVESTKSLELNLTTITPKLCIDSTLLLELKVTNVSNEDVIVDMSKLWRKFSYSFAGSADEGRNQSMGIGTPRKQEENMVLRPGTTFHSSHEFALVFDFFQVTGEYTLKTYINSLFSNDVKFELYECGASQKIEDKQ